MYTYSIENTVCKIVRIPNLVDLTARMRSIFYNVVCCVNAPGCWWGGLIYVFTREAAALSPSPPSLHRPPQSPPRGARVRVRVRVARAAAAPAALAEDAREQR